MKHPEKLDIIDEQENIIDQVPRDEVHIKGLLHREVHVWLYTPDNKIIFQKRSATKDTFPNLLDASVGGHVDLGETPEIASVKELEEEAGITADISELNFIDKKRSNSTDPQTGKINNVIRYVYSYLYTGGIADLTLEEGKGDGFVAYSISELENLDEETRKEFIPRMISEGNIEMYKDVLTKEQKIILIDAVNTFVDKKTGMFQEMYELLEQYVNKKIILTNADNEQMEKFGLNDLPYEVFTLKHNPNKPDPVYFETMLKHFNLKASDVIYFEHNEDAVKSAKSVGITTYHYNSETKDLEALQDFIKNNI